MPADAPQARIAAEIVIVHEATDDTFARANAPGLTVEQVCRLRRTAAALTASVTALERTLAWHQQKSVPFFGTVLADGIDVAALAEGWGSPGSRRDDAEAPGGDAGGSADGPVPPGMARNNPGSSARGQGLPAMTRGPGPAPATERKGPPRPRQDAEATSGVVTRLDQGPGWTLDVVRPRTGGDVAAGAAPGPVA